MSGARPNSEAARRGGLVPFTGSSNGRNNKNDGSAGYPNISSNKSGNFGGNPAPENVKNSSKGGNDQLWSNGSGTYTPGSAPVWPENQRGAPAGPAASANPSNNFDNRQTAGSGPVGGGYIQAPQPGQGPQQQQQQPPNSQSRDVQQGVPANSGNNWQNNQPGGYGQGAPGVNGSQQQGVPANGSQQTNWQGPQGGFITPGPQKGPVPKGDYVYYDGSGNQIQPGAPPPGATGSGHWTGSGSDRHFHHHYYYNNQQQQQQPQQPQAPVGYPYDKKMEQKKKRKPGATALAAALVACWACTCCCHAPCGC